MKKLIMNVFFIVASAFLYIFIHELIHVIFCMINPRVEMLELRLGINNCVIWIGEITGGYSKVISYSSHIFMFIIPFIMFLFSSKKCLISHFITTVFIVINILVLSFSILISTQQELNWLSSIGLFKYILLLSFIGLFIIVFHDSSRSVLEGNLKQFLPIFISILLAYITIFIWIKIDFINHYQFENQISNQEIYLFESDVYLLRNDSDSLITLVISTNSDEEYEVQLKQNQYIKIAFLEYDTVSYSCVDCASDFGIVVYRFIGGD